ncbi:uncharacterized protein LOC122257025 isoform X2 [Penaeus japonicus]|nr:uncharacterized protein LOC122257025 isoform X2 [Penaeus japonicus]XP_042877981.1 uncharacterized protein LOC122257025 isoform X2 [Penaeus japonicus]
MSSAADSDPNASSSADAGMDTVSATARKDMSPKAGRPKKKLKDMYKNLKGRGFFDPMWDELEYLDDDEIDSDDSDDYYHDLVMMRLARGHKYPFSRQAPMQEQGPAKWKPPPMRLPDVEGEEEELMEDVSTDGRVDVGPVRSDAKVFEAKEKTASGEIKTHFLLRMPSAIPAELCPDPSRGTGPAAANCLNILMADVSGSMTSYWSSVVSGWNTYVSPKLKGTTEIYVFGSLVKHRRTGNTLMNQDFSSGQTDLTTALQTIVNNVYKCRQKYVKVFLITDGDHNQTDESPEGVISQMKVPQGKVCDVYLLGAGTEFPVEYSINIRSRLHNGSANLPTIFWAKSPYDVEDQMEAIGMTLASQNERSLTLSVPGWKLPGDASMQKFHVLEWVYFPEDPEKHESLKVLYNNCKGQLAAERSTVTTQILTEVFRQWNSVAIQNHNTEKRIPSDLLPFMERLFNTSLELGTEGHSVAARLARISIKTAEVEFRTNMNKIKDILTTEKYRDGLKLAENILSTTVSAGKYQAKSLQLKGHSDADYEKDSQEFKKVYATKEAELKALTVTPEECCRITMASTISDLQDDDFLQLLDLNKYDFLKQFTMSGIPVFSPTRDAVSLNPWSYNIQRILKSPYTTMSQVALESYASNQAPGARHKDVKLKDDDDNTHFNAVIPVFSPEAAKVMEPLVQTRLYTMCATFAILKNPYIIEFNVHMAALATCWVRILYEHPEVPRPEYIRSREESIIATASLYMKRKGYVNYCKLLKEDTPQALMTESTVKINDRSVKCESLIKPMFMLHLIKQNEDLDMGEVAKIVKLILLEFVGRNMSHVNSSKKEDTPFTDFFVEVLKDEDKKKEWLQKYVQATRTKMSNSGDFPLSKFYRLEEVQKAARKETKMQIRALRENLAPPIQIDTEKVERLYSVSLAGAVSWRTLKTFAKEMGLSKEVIEELFGEKSVLLYVQHALRHKSSRERLSAKLDSYEDAFSYVMKQVEKESFSGLAGALEDELVNFLQKSWLTEYMAAHSAVVKPMTREQILAEAAARGIEVTDATFDQVYRKYRPHLGLLTNACQCPSCPFFLQPNKRYNQHAIVERWTATLFPHGLHQVTYNCREEGIQKVISEFQNGSHRKHKGQGEPVPREAIAPLVQDMEQLRIMYSETR